MFGILNFFFDKRSVGSSSPFDFSTKVVVKPLTEIANHTFLDLRKRDVNISLSTCSLIAEKNMSTAVAVYQPASEGSLLDKIKTLWNEVISKPLMLPIAPLTVKTTESTALSLYNGPELAPWSFRLVWNRLLKASEPVTILEPKSSVLAPTLAVTTAKNTAQQTTIFSYLPKFPITNKKIEEKIFSTSFYNGQEASEQGFCEAWSQTLKKPLVNQNYTASGFYTRPEASHEGFEKMWNEAVNSTKTPTQPEVAYAKYVLYGLCALTACYFIYKKLNSKEIDQKGHKGNEFERFKKSVEEITTPPITTAQASGESRVSTKTVEVEAAKKMTVFKKILSFMDSLIHVITSIFNLEFIFPSKGSKILLP